MSHSEWCAGSAEPILYQSETAKMHDAMRLAHGADVSETWVRNMIEHHRGAVVMSDILLRQKKVPAAIWRTAEATRSDQQKEIHVLEHILQGKPGNSLSVAFGDGVAAPSGRWGTFHFSSRRSGLQ